MTVQTDISAVLTRALHRPDPMRSRRGTGMGMRGLALLTLVVWGVFTIVSLAYAWEAVGQRLDMIWRPLMSDVVGAALSIVVALCLAETRHWATGYRMLLAAALSLAAVTAYSVAAAWLIAPIRPDPAFGTEAGAQIFRMMAIHYWVFIAYAGFFLLLDQSGNETPDAAAADVRYRDLRSALLGVADDYDGLDARWFWTFQVVFWSAMFVFSSANTINAGDSPLNIWRIGLAETIGLAVSSVAHYAVMRPSRYWPLYSRAALAMGTAVILTAAYITGIWAAYFQFFPLQAPTENGETLNTGWRYLLYQAPRWMFLNFPVFVGWSGFYLALDAARRLRSQERQLYNSVMLAQDSQLKMLRFQLNPHFLFNTLNAISTLLLDNRSEEAEAMLTRLSRFLRFTLDAAPDDRVPLSREIDAQRLYLEIEKARFVERLQVEIVVEAGCETALVPTLILQPLLENAVKYAVARSTDPVHLSVTARTSGAGQLILRVEDSGAAEGGHPIEGGSGVGLTNIRARLNALYGARATLDAGPTEAGGYAVRIAMPLERQRSPGGRKEEG